MFWSHFASALNSAAGSIFRATNLFREHGVEALIDGRGRESPSNIVAIEILLLARGIEAFLDDSYSLHVLTTYNQTITESNFNHLAETFEYSELPQKITWTDLEDSR